MWEGIKERPTLVDRLRRIKVLFIDEISLLKGNEIDAIDSVFRKLACDERHASIPFGGRIVVFAGDPFQLEPCEEGSSVQVETRDTAYQSRSWYLTFGPLGDGTVVVLGQNHRQSKDPNFFQMLNRIRVGGHSGEDLSLLNATSAGMPKPTDKHTRLFPTNAQVAEINRDVLSKLPGDLLQISSRDTFLVRRTAGIEARLNWAAPKVIFLKIGARVILTRKVGNTLPGSQGVINRIMNLTRVRNNPRYQVDILIFSLDFTKNGKSLRIGIACFDVHGYNREVIASREQLPIIPAYAMTIHRSQGLTMEHVAIDFSAVKKWRPVGLVYVALSRCRSLSGLWVKNLKDDHIRVSPRAFQLMNDIWTLKLHFPFRVNGVETRACLGFDDILEVISISDDEEDQADDEVLCWGNTTFSQNMKKEDLTITEVRDPSINKRNIQGPVIHGKRRCFAWYKKEL